MQDSVSTEPGLLELWGNSVLKQSYLFIFYYFTYVKVHKVVNNITRTAVMATKALQVRLHLNVQ